MPELKLIDSHAHPQMKAYDQDRQAVIKRSLDQGIGMIVVGTTLQDSREASELAERHDNGVWAAVGVHPTDGDLGEIHPTQLHELLNHPKVVAIGETGLDFYRLDPDDEETRQLQVDVFEQHVLLAKQLNKPVMIHTRDRDGIFDAYDQTLALLQRHSITRFVMHTYGGDWGRAEKFLDLGGYLSFSGILTFPKSEMMQEVAKQAPIDRILVETDAPFLTPEPHRGQRNEPAYVQFVAERLAQIRKSKQAEVEQATLRNTKRFLGL